MLEKQSEISIIEEVESSKSFIRIMENEFDKLLIDRCIKHRWKIERADYTICVEDMTYYYCSFHEARSIDKKIMSEVLYFVMKRHDYEIPKRYKKTPLINQILELRNK